MSDLTVRALERGDLDEVVELERELFGAAAWSKATYELELRTDGRRYLAVTAKQVGVVGYAGIALVDDAEVMTVGVAPAWRRLGIGTRLLTALLDEARAARCRRVFLEVRADDDGAQRLYRRAGFRPVGIRRAYYQPEGADAVVMRLDIEARLSSEAVVPQRVGEP